MRAKFPALDLVLIDPARQPGGDFFA